MPVKTQIASGSSSTTTKRILVLSNIHIDRPQSTPSRRSSSFKEYTQNVQKELDAQRAQVRDTAMIWYLPMVSVTLQSTVTST